MSERFVERMNDPGVVRDTVTMGDFAAIWCDGHHRDRTRRPIQSQGAALGVYGRTIPVLCEECEAHIAYAEKRRAFCPHDPKPFCAYCETHCYKPDERAWQREMMRYSGPRSWRKGHTIDGIKHLLDGRKYKKRAEAKARAVSEASASTAPAGQAESNPRGNPDE